VYICYALYLRSDEDFDSLRANIGHVCHCTVVVQAEVTLKAKRFQSLFS
jgi:hypothetical protein